MHTTNQKESNNQRTSFVLVAEDEPSVRLIMGKQLEHLGYQVDFASDGSAAVRQFELNRYCMIFMDIQMPLMTGLQATAAIRSHESAEGKPPVPIIATTAGGAPRELCLSVGMTDFLEKPVTIEMLDKTLAKWKCNKTCAAMLP